MGSEGAVADQSRDHEEVADRVGAVRRDVAGVVGDFTGGDGPAGAGGAGGVAHLLLLFVEALLRHFLPGKAQVALCGDEPEADIRAAAEEDRAAVAVVLFASEVFGDRLVREIAGGENVRYL